MSEKKIPYLERTLDIEVPELIPYLRAGMNVLDVGCGPGTITLDVAEVVKPGKVVGIDIDERKLQKALALAAESGADNATFQIMDAHTLDFPDQTFDLVYTHTALHSVRDPVYALKEQKRVTKEGGWIMAAGLRDWGYIPRYPPTPTWDSVYETHARYADFLRENPDHREPLFLCNGYPQASRRCAEWFTEAGLKDLDVQVKVYRVQYPGAEEAAPHPLDLLLYDDDEDEFGWYAGFTETYQAMIEDGFIDEETLEKAKQEALAWYENPHAFHFWVMVSAAGRV